MPGEDRVGQVVEPLATAVTAVALPLGLGVIVAVPGDLRRATRGAPHAVGPAHRPDCLEALGVVDEGLDVDHRRASLGAEPASEAIPLSCRVYPREDAAGITTLESRMSLPRLA